MKFQKVKCPVLAHVTEKLFDETVIVKIVVHVILQTIFDIGNQIFDHLPLRI